MLKKRGDFMKVQVNVNDDMVKKIDQYAKAMGVSRSSLCAMFIGQGVLGFDKAYEIVNTYTENILEGVKEDGKEQ